MFKKLKIDTLVVVLLTMFVVGIFCASKSFCPEFFAWGKYYLGSLFRPLIVIPCFAIPLYVFVTDDRFREI